MRRPINVVLSFVYLIWFVAWSFLILFVLGAMFSPLHEIIPFTVLIFLWFFISRITEWARDNTPFGKLEDWARRQ